MLDIQVVHGNGAAGGAACGQRGESDLLIAATSADESQSAVLHCREKLGCRHTIARVRNPE